MIASLSPDPPLRIDLHGSDRQVWPMKRKPDAALLKRNAEAHAAKVKRVRQGTMAHALKVKNERLHKEKVALGSELPVEHEQEIRVAIEKRMASVPDDNPVKILAEQTGHNPLSELFRIAKQRKTPQKEKIEINKFLTTHLVPKMKAVDTQSRIKASVTVKVQSFKQASQKALKQVDQFVDADYEEFEESEDA